MLTASLCSGEARKRRGNQASGTLNVRPSDSSTQKLSSSKRTLLALTKEFIPGPQYEFAPLRDDFRQFAQGSSIETVIVADGDFRRQPEFCVDAVFDRVNMGRLAWIAFIGIENEPKALVAENDRHVRSHPWNHQRRSARIEPDEEAPHPSIFSAAMNASCGMSTLPNWRIFFLPAFCFSSSLRLRVASPP